MVSETYLFQTFGISYVSFIICSICIEINWFIIHTCLAAYRQKLFASVNLHRHVMRLNLHTSRSEDESYKAEQSTFCSQEGQGTTLRRRRPASHGLMHHCHERSNGGRGDVTHQGLLSQLRFILAGCRLRIVHRFSSASRAARYSRPVRAASLV